VSTSFQRQIASQLLVIFSQKPARHIAFWFAFLCFLVLLDNKEYGVVYAIAKHVINIFFYSLVVYFNLYYLIPGYLKQKTLVTYVLLLILTVVIITPIKALVFYFLFAGSPVYREYVTFHQQYIFALTFFIAAGSTVLKITYDWLFHQRDRKDLETQNMQSELKFLKSQINPHFLFNTLNSIYALTLKKSDKAPEIVIKLSEMMRYMLYECNERLVPLSKEVLYVRNYVDLEMLRQGQKVRIDFRVEGDIHDQRIAPLIFTPFLENSFKHGVNQISEGFVDILLEVQDENVILQIENSKPPKQQIVNHKKPSGGIGLANVKRRLDLLYPESYILNITEQHDRYKVYLNLELNSVIELETRLLSKS
jgi:sensor histidine kinase YesM